MIPYVELLAYYVDLYNLPQWYNYIPSLLILLVVIISTLLQPAEKEKEEPEPETATGLKSG